MLKFKYSPLDYIVNGAQWEAPKESWLSKFDQLLMSRWDAIMEAGHFRYNLDDVLHRIIPGDQKFVFQLNKKRGTMRRKPERIKHLNMPFNPEIFNFTQVKPEEIMFELVPVEDGKEDSAGRQLSLNDERCMNGYQEVQCPGTNRSRKHPETNKSQVERHLMLVNVSPLDYGHTLVVPNVDGKIYQKLTKSAVKMAIELVLLSSHPGMRVGFNSLCALASVNHQHFHTWYLEYQLPIETAEVRPVCKGMYEMVGMPTRAFVFQLHGNTVDQVTRMVYTTTNYLQQNEIAHNVFLTRGTQFGNQGRDTPRTVRLYIWPRKSIIGMKNESGETFNVAVAELAGHIPVYVAERFMDMTEAEIVKTIQDNLITDTEFDRLKLEVAAVLSEFNSENSQTIHS